MGLFGKKGGGGKRVRIFFMTDVHGSERTYRKFINSAKFYKVDHLVMGGDIEGKYLVPIVDEGGGHYRVTLQEELFKLNGTDELKGVQDRIETLGFYYVVVSEDEIRAMQEDKSLVDAAFKKEAHARLQRWIALADERLADTDIKCYVTGGNDDPQELVDLLEASQSDHVINCEGRIVTLDDTFPMANCGYSNPTPWDTPRETDEETLEKYLEESLQGIDDFTNAIFNFHVPPYDSTLDDCPKLDWSTDPPSPIDRRRRGAVGARRQPRGPQRGRAPSAAARAHRAHPRVARLGQDQALDYREPGQRVRRRDPEGVHPDIGAGQDRGLSDDVGVRLLASSLDVTVTRSSRV